MKLNKVLEAENADFRKEINELRDRDIANFVYGWNLFQKNQQLWEALEGLACDLFVLYNPWERDVIRYATKKENGKTRIATLGVSKRRRREIKCLV